LVKKKWKDVWFRKLSPEHKILWFFFIDQCDIAGFVPIDIEVIEFYTGTKTTKDEILSIFSDRISETDDGYFFITKFIEFQQGVKIEELNQSNNSHKAILRSLHKHSIKEKVIPSEGIGIPSEGLPNPPSNSNSISNGNSNVLDLVQKSSPSGKALEQHLLQTWGGNDGRVSPSLAMQYIQLGDKHGWDKLFEAIETAEVYNKKSFAYVKAILEPSQTKTGTEKQSDQAMENWLKKKQSEIKK